MTNKQWDALMKLTVNGKVVHTTPMLVGDVSLSFVDVNTSMTIGPLNNEEHFLLELPTRKSKLYKDLEIGKVDREYLRYMYSEWTQVILPQVMDMNL